MSETISKREKSELVVISVTELLQKNLPKRVNLLNPWLPKQGLAMIYAARGVGKTHVGLNVGYAVASGGEFLGWKAESPAGVLYLDGEMPAIIMQERLQSIEKSNSKKISAPFNIVTPDLQSGAMPDLATLEGQKAIETHLIGIELIIVDNISTLCRSGKENEAEGWILVQEWALQMRAAGRSVLFIHHAGKGGNQRGTSKREDVLDTVISLKRSEDYEPMQGSVFEIHFEKSRTFYGEDAQPLKVTLSTDDENLQHWKIDKLNKSSYEKIIELSRNGLKQHEIAEELDLDKSRVSRHMKRAKEEGKLS